MALKNFAVIKDEVVMAIFLQRCSQNKEKESNFGRFWQRWVVLLHTLKIGTISAGILQWVKGGGQAAVDASR